MTTFQRTNSGPLDEIDEELALLDGAPPRSEELRELDAWWRAQERVLPPDYGTPHPLHAGRSQQPSRARPAAVWWGAAAAALAIAAAAALFVHLTQAPEEHRVMGALPVDVVAARGAQAVDLGALQEGDLLFVTVTAPRDGCLSVGTVSGAGGAQPLTTVPVARGQRATPGAALRLDGATDPEWLVVQLDDCGAPAQLEASARADRFVLDVTRAGAR